MLTSSKCYKVLGLSNGASRKEVKQAYRRLSLKYHPDRTKEKNSDLHFREIIEAYQFLKNEYKREVKSSSRKSDRAYADFWQYYNMSKSNDFYFHEKNISASREDFESSANQSNRAKPISQKTTHLILYVGLALIALWIILSDILK